jgi:hypothetical protein
LINNPFVQLYKAGELIYSGVQLYELKIDSNFTNGASRETLTFDLDDDLIEQLALDEIPEILSQSQSQLPVLEPRLAGPSHDSNDEGIDLDVESVPSLDSYEFVDDEEAFEYQDGRDCCYDYAAVTAAMLSFSQLTKTITQTTSFENQMKHLDSFIKSSDKLLQVDPLPNAAYMTWKTIHSKTFIDGTFIHFSVLSRLNDYNFNFPVIDRAIFELQSLVSNAMEVPIPSSSDGPSNSPQLKLKAFEDIKSQLETMLDIKPTTLLTAPQIKSRDAELVQLAADRKKEVDRQKREREEENDDEAHFSADDEVTSGDLAAIKRGRKR